MLTKHVYALHPSPPPPPPIHLQAGKQLEWLTGGRVKAGMHEVRQGLIDGGGQLVFEVLCVGLARQRLECMMWAHCEKGELG